MHYITPLGVLVLAMFATLQVLAQEVSDDKAIKKIEKEYWFTMTKGTAEIFKI